MKGYIMKNNKVKEPNLIVIDGTKHTFFKGKEKILSITSSDINKEQIEYYRDNHDQLLIDTSGIPEEIPMTTITTEEYESLIDDVEWLNKIVLGKLSKDEWITNYEENFDPT